MRVELSQLGPKARAQIARKLEEQNPEAKAMRELLTGRQKRGKYGAVRTWADGVPFDSGWEAEYYGRLKLLLRAGGIAGFLYHGKFILVEGEGPDHRAVTYEPDFVVLNNDHTYRIVDTKGMETAQFKDKMKMMRGKFPKVEVKLERR